MIELQIGADEGNLEISRALGLMREAIGSMEPTWRDVMHPYINRHMLFQFQSEGSHGGQPWAGYGSEPKYKAMKKSMVGHLKVLRWYEDIDRGQLPPSLHDKAHPQHKFEADADRVTIGSTVAHASRLTRAGTNQFGEPRPARRIMAFTSYQKDDMASLIQQNIIERTDSDSLRAAARGFQRKLHSMLGR